MGMPDSRSFPDRASSLLKHPVKQQHQQTRTATRRGGRVVGTMLTQSHTESVKKRRGRFSLTDDSSREGVLSGSKRPCLVFVVHTDLCKNSRSWVKDKNKTTRSQN